MEITCYCRHESCNTSTAKSEVSDQTTSTTNITNTFDMVKHTNTETELTLLLRS
jgi:hypothetical protein